MNDTVFDVELEETLDTSKHSMNTSSIYTVKRNKTRLPIGGYGNLLELHKRLKLAINYNFIDNVKSPFKMSYNDKYFYIRHVDTNCCLGMPKEFIPKFASNIGKYIYNKMIENKNKNITSKKSS